MTNEELVKKFYEWRATKNNASNVSLSQEDVVSRFWQWKKNKSLQQKSIQKTPLVKETLKAIWELPSTSREGWAKIYNKIEPVFQRVSGLEPKKQTTFWRTFFANTPRALAETFTDFASGYVSPITLATMGIMRSPVGRKIWQRIFKKIPALTKEIPWLTKTTIATKISPNAPTRVMSREEVTQAIKNAPDSVKKTIIQMLNKGESFAIVKGEKPIAGILRKILGGAPIKYGVAFHRPTGVVPPTKPPAFPKALPPAKVKPALTGVLPKLPAGAIPEPAPSPIMEQAVNVLNTKAPEEAKIIINRLAYSHRGELRKIGIKPSRFYGEALRRWIDISETRKPPEEMPLVTPPPEVTPPAERIKPIEVAPEPTKAPEVTKPEEVIPKEEVKIRNVTKQKAEQIAKTGDTIEPDELNEGKWQVVKYPPDNAEAGFLKLNAFKKLLEKAVDMVSIQEKFKRINAPKTGKAIKTYFDKQIAEMERGKDTVRDLTKLKFNLPEYIETTFVSSQPTLLKRYSPEQRKKMVIASQKVRNFFDKHFEKSKEKEILVMPFPKSLVSRLENENLHYGEVIKKITNKEKIEKLQAIINRNKDVIKFLKTQKIKYVHLPLRVWLEDLFEQQPQKAPKIISRFFRTRETADLKAFAQTLLKEGIIKPEDVDIRTIISAYARKVGRMYALSDIFNSAKEEGLVKPLENAPGDWVLPPARLVPEMKGYKIHPAFSEYLEGFLKATGKGYNISRLLAYIKIMQFDNPIFLPVYDLNQSAWAGALTNIKAPKYLYQGFKSVIKRDDAFYLAFDKGAFSQPYRPPFKDYMKEIEVLKEKNFFKRAIKIIQQSTNTPLDLIYRPIFNIAWTGDRAIRMSTFHYLLDKGFSAEEAGDLTALLHSDYADVPPNLRKVLNKIFFTPIFPITMAKAQSSMIKSAGKVFWNASRMKPSSKKDKILARGLLFLLGIQFARKALMKKLGFKEEDYGVRYVKTITTPEGERRELVVYIPSPDNVLLRYYHRWTKWTPEEGYMLQIINKAKWSAHPLWRTMIDLIQNRKPDGTPISPYILDFKDKDASIKIAEDYFVYTLKSLIRVSRWVMGEPTEKKRRENFNALKRDIGKVSYLLNLVSTTYIRQSKDVRKIYQANRVKRIFLRYFKASPPKTDKELQLRMKQLEKLLNNALGEFK